MDYQIVTLNEKFAMGISATTNNNSPDMSSVIGGLWERFFNDGIFSSIENKSNEKSLGIYSDYAENGDYSVSVACEINGKPSSSQDLSVITIPAGKYARFVVRGNCVTAVADFWEKLWKMDLPRSFVCDFEEYQNSSCEDAEIHIYISLSE